MGEGLAMANREWPVEVVDFGSLLGRIVPAGEPTQATRTFDIDSETHGYILNCPKCGDLGHCELAPGDHEQTSGEGEPLTLTLSILCRCGGHFWLSDGVLREG